MRCSTVWRVLAVLLGASVAHAQQTFTVGKGGGYDFATIQEAVDAATAGDTIIVYPAIYYENIHLKGKRLVLRSTNPTNPATVAATIIDGNDRNPVVTFAGTESSSCVLSGFTIRNGRAKGPSPWTRCGGGIRGGTETTPTLALIENNVITSNSAWDGGGIAYCNGTIRNNTITSNTAEDDGGGLHRCNGLVQNNTITRNAAWDGGGLSKCSGVVEGNTISENQTRDDGAGFFSCDAWIRNNTIHANRAGDEGGGLTRCNATVEINRITSNTAMWDGGGLSRCDGTVQNNTITGNTSIYGGGLANCSGLIQNNLIAANVSQAGGGLSYSQGTILNNTITSNTALATWMPPGGGLYGCSGAIRNCIVWGNRPSQLETCSSPTYCCIEGWTLGGLGNIAGNPLFANWMASNYRLAGGSPCINQGANGFWWAWPQRDLDGNCRLAGPRVDMGCYEYGSSADTDGDLLANTSETIRGANPSREDTDGDGLRDGLEVLRQSNPLVATPLGTINLPGPVATIQEALAVSRDGEQIVVAPGTYTANLQFCGANPTLRSVNPLSSTTVAATILDGGGYGPVVSFRGTESSSCVLAGFTIQHGIAQSGGGICGGTFEVRTHASIERNVIRYNLAEGTGGGVAFCAGSIQNNTITSNSATSDGGGLYACDGVIQNNLVSLNRSIEDGGGMDDCDGIIQNNLILANTASREGGALSGCDGSILNNTVVGNTAAQEGGSLNHCLGIIRNCILWDNSGQIVYGEIRDSNTPSNCCIKGWTGGGSNNLSTSPLFVNAAAGNYRLQSGSPCRDAGVDFYWYAWPMRDLDGNCRLAGSHVDIGCYEYNASVDSDGDLLSDTAEAGRGTNTQNPDSDGDGLRDGLEVLRATNPLQRNTSQTVAVSPTTGGIQKALCLAIEGDVIVVPTGRHFGNHHFCGPNVVLRSANPQNPAIVAATILDGRLEGPTVVLMGGESPACVLDGLAIQNGHADHGANVQGGMSARHSLATIRNNIITSGTAVRGGAGAAWCDGLVEGNTFWNNYATNDGGGVSQCQGTIRNNTLEANMAQWDGGGLAHCNGLVYGNTFRYNIAVGNGGGVARCLGTIQGNVFTSNTARHGGGVGSCEALIENNVFTYNGARRGGAIAYCARSTIRGNTITLNRAFLVGDYGGFGGGIYDCKPVIEGNTITDNIALRSGGGIDLCDSLIQNNIIANNSSGVGGGVASCPGTLRNNTIAMNIAAAGGGGLSDCREAVIVNCILWGNTAPTYPQFDQFTSSPIYSCIQDYAGSGVGNIALNPRFWWPGDFRLRSYSPCIDAGMSIADLAADIEGNARPYDGNSDGDARFDMGAYEYVGLSPSSVRRQTWLRYR